MRPWNSSCRFMAGLMIWTGFFTALPSCAQNADTAPMMAVISPTNSFDFTIYKGRTAVATLGVGGWAPNWGWRGFGANKPAEGKELNVTAPFESNKATGEIINVALNARESGPKQLTFQYTLTADKDVPLTMLIAGYKNLKPAQDGEAILAQANAGETKWPLSFAGIRGTGETSRVTMPSASLGTTTLTLEPALPLMTDNQLRILLAKDKFPAGTKTVTLTFNFPEKIKLLAGAEDIARFTKTLPGPGWFAFTPSKDVGPSALGFQDWLEKPAGKRGAVRMVGDRFEFEDKTPVKFWGTNLSYGGVAPEKANADFTAARFAKWGVNAVRLHKFQGVGWAGISDANDATKTNPQGLDRLDYFASQLTANGVYYGWSHTFKFEVRPGNKDRLLAYDEIQKNLKGNTYAFINIAEDVQDLMIEWVVNLLKHKNPYTGKTYAEDPALAFVELQNEDDIFFYTTEGAINACPTYKKRFQERYASWLTDKYKTTDGLRQAWGSALRGNESLEAKNIALHANPWLFGDQNLPRAKPEERQRLLDNAAYFHDVQNAFYSRFAKAIRDAGYQGPLIGSPWQAPSMLPHYYNLRSDALVGYVDRHNYFGGGLNDTMLNNPGGGLLSSGLQQVANRPFGFSEWIHVYPSLYSAEGPALMAAYGMGLQGWDASYEFQSESKDSAFSAIAGNFPWGIWNADVPTQIGQFPLLARMIMRGDVKEGEVISVRRISPQNLAEGKFDFTENIQQEGDVKSFGGGVPAKALAAGRVLVDFSEAGQPTTLPDLSRLEQNGVIRSNTGQLSWNPAGQGYFTIDTPGTKAVVGFAPGQVCKLGNVSLKIDSPYASLIVTAADKGSDLSNAKRALISVVARNSNSGMTYFDLDNRVLENGKGPILMEPAKASMSFAGRPIAAVNVLDQDGKDAGRTLPVKNGAVELDSGRDKTMYYEVVFG